MVLAHAEERQADLVGDHGLLDDMAKHLRVVEKPAVAAGRDVTEGVEAELDLCGRQGLHRSSVPGQVQAPPIANGFDANADQRFFAARFRPVAPARPLSPASDRAPRAADGALPDARPPDVRRDADAPARFAPADLGGAASLCAAASGFRFRPRAAR